MVTKLKSITFNFENCDYITIDGKYIGYFLVEDIRTSIERVAINAIMKMNTAYTFAIEIHKDANKERYAFGQIDCERLKEITFDRFKAYDDITSIEFELEERYVDEGEMPHIEHYNYYVNWTGDSDYTNDSQTSYISDDGNLYIVIAQGKTIEDFFDIEMIDDKESMDFYFDMNDVGDKYGNPNRYDIEESSEV
jgi:hypothetical protein